MNPEKIKQKFDKFLDQKLARVDSKQKVAILAIAMVLPLVLFYFLLYSPKQEEITKLQKNKSSLEQQIRELAATARKIDEHRAMMAETEYKFSLASVLLPDQKEIPSLLTNISSLATNSGLEVLAFKPRPEAKKEFYAEIPVDIQVRGSYHNYGYFLYQVSKLPRIVSVSNVKMGSPKVVDSGMELNTDFNLVTYRFLEPRELETNDRSKPDARSRKKKK
jgi:type IV pilus assembly protein PilO